MEPINHPLVKKHIVGYEAMCTKCGNFFRNQKVMEYSIKRYNEPICWECQQKIQNSESQTREEVKDNAS